MVRPVGERSADIDNLVISFGKISKDKDDSWFSKEVAKVVWNGFVVARVKSVVQTLKSTIDTVESAFELAIATLRSAIFGLAFTNRELRENMFNAGVNLIQDVSNVVFSVIGVAVPQFLAWMKDKADENGVGSWGTNKPVAEPTLA